MKLACHLFFFAFLSCEKIMAFMLQHPAMCEIVRMNSEYSLYMGKCIRIWCGESSPDSSPSLHPGVFDQIRIIFQMIFSLKKIENSSNTSFFRRVRVALTEDGVPMSTLREIALLKSLDAFKHPNIVK